MERRITAALAAGGLLLTTFVAAGAQPAAQPEIRPLSLDEARRTVRLMNDIYVTGVLTTHRMYAHEAGTAAAISWGKQVIREINTKGWPRARVFATTERALNPENQPADAFEKDAGTAFGKGQPAFERVSGNTYRYATPIRITMDSCLSCHVKNKVGDLIGGVSYQAVLKPR